MSWPRLRRDSLRTRLLVGAGLWLALALGGAGLLIQHILSTEIRAESETRLDEIMLGLAAAAEFDALGRLQVSRSPLEPGFERVGSGWTWRIHSPEGVLAASPSSGDLGLPPPPWSATGATGAKGGQRIDDALGQPLLRRWWRLTLPGAPIPVLIEASRPAEPVDEALSRVGTSLWLSLAVLGLGLLLAVAAQVHVGLRPLQRLARQLQAVRSGQTEQLGPAPVREVLMLTEEIDRLLAHTRERLVRSREHVGNLAHALKTPLSILQAVSERSPPDIARQLQPSVQRMQAQIDYQLRRARIAGAHDVLGAPVALAPLIAETLELMRLMHGRRGVAFVADVPADLRFRGERGDLEDMLANLLDNAGKWARATVRIDACRVSDTRLRVTVDDDGPGLPENARAAVLERGTQLDLQMPGHGLGLSIVGELVEIYGGALSFDDAAGGGLRVCLELPAAPPAAPARI